MRKIVTYHAYPPIPVRTFDWLAYYDGDEEAGQYGHGPTEEAAIADFIENCQEDCDLRLDGPAKAAQAARCSCRGTDEYCPCQNVPDAETRRAREQQS